MMGSIAGSMFDHLDGQCFDHVETFSGSDGVMKKNV